MNVSELILLISKYPGETPVKILHNSTIPDAEPRDFYDDEILLTSENAFIDSSAPEDEWDHEDGKVTQSGSPYILINPIML